MEQWTKTSLLLCVFGFLKAILPSELFVYEFMTGPWRNLTDNEVLKEVYPVGTYSYMILLIFVILITDMCRYKPLIITLGLSGIVTWGMLLWTTSLFNLQLVQVFYALFLATEVAYYAYIYTKVDKEHYDKVSSYTRAGILAGRTISGISSQLFISLEWMDYRQLNYISFASVTAGTIWALFLPAVDKSIYFHLEHARELPFTKRTNLAFTMMKSHFTNAFTDLHVVKWSAWYALSTCGYFQIENYYQPLYSVTRNLDEDAYNGAVGATATLLSFLATFLAGHLNVNWEVKGELVLGVFSLIQGMLIVTISQTHYIFLSYSFYILFAILYNFMVTVASAQIAKSIDEDSFGLIFGINSFIALVFNSILTVVVATEGIGFALGPRDQFIVYGSYHVVFSIFFIFVGVRTCVMNRRREDNEEENGGSVCG